MIYKRIYSIFVTDVIITLLDRFSDCDNIAQKPTHLPYSTHDVIFKVKISLCELGWLLLAILIWNMDLENTQGSYSVANILTIYPVSKLMYIFTREKIFFSKEISILNFCSFLKIQQFNYKNLMRFIF